MSKIKILDSNKTVRTAKLVTIALLSSLLFWFTFDITGLKIGQTKLVTSAFIDEPIDFVFWLFLSEVLFYLS